MDTFEISRKKLLEEMVRIAKERGEKVERRTIPFRNNDVPEFLKNLDESEALSRQSKIVVKDYSPVTFLYN